MGYPSLLYTSSPSAKPYGDNVFGDVKLLQLVGSDILPAMNRPCSKDDILARQQLMRSVEDETFRARLALIYEESERMAGYNDRYTTAVTDAERYCSFVCLMRSYISFCRLACALGSEGLLASRFSEFFSAEIKKAYFSRAVTHTEDMELKMNEFRRNLFTITGETLRVSPEAAPSFTTKIARCSSELGLDNSVPSKPLHKTLSPAIIEASVSWHPSELAVLKEYYDSFRSYFAPALLDYRVELAFYLQIFSIFDKVKVAGIPVCYPEVSSERRILVASAYDITLMTKDNMKIIPNDISFDDSEPFFYLTGANGGGKTTYLRTVAVTVLLFLAGCPVPAKQATIYPISNVLTHFPMDERFESSGRFEDEEKRVDNLLSDVNSSSLVLLNETYSTSSEEQAVVLTQELAEKLYNGGCYGIYITHQHSLTETKIPYLNVVVDHSDANRRTYKVAKARGDQGSFAYDVLKRYRLTAEALSERFSSGRGSIPRP